MKKLVAALTILTFVSTLPVFAEDKKAESENKEIKGEIVDIACYTDHGASGDKHSGCGTKCVTSGMPVGIKAEDGTVYTVIGEHKPMNSTLAPLVGKTVTLRGKAVSRGGVNLLENAELVK